MGIISDGHREASATTRVLVASSVPPPLPDALRARWGMTRCGQGSAAADPLCLPQLPELANYECDCSDPRHTQLAQSKPKRRRHGEQGIIQDGTTMNIACQRDGSTCDYDNIVQFESAQGSHEEWPDGDIDNRVIQSSQLNCTGIL